MYPLVCRETLSASKALASPPDAVRRFPRVDYFRLFAIARWAIHVRQNLAPPVAPRSRRRANWQQRESKTILDLDRWPRYPQEAAERTHAILARITTYCGWTENLHYSW